MARYLIGVAAAFIFMTGAFFIWQSKAAKPKLARVPFAATAMVPDAPLTLAGLSAPRAFARQAPEATPASREQKRFTRADKNDDGRLDKAEMFDPRRKAYAKLDADANGTLSFEEWATKTVEKFASADKDRSGWLSATEYATTAPPPPKRRPACAC